MANPSAAAVAWIRGQSPNWGQTDTQIAAALNAATVNNPVSSAPEIPRVMFESELAALLDQTPGGSLAKVLGYANFGLVKADIEANNRVGLALWGPKLALLGLVTTAEAGAIATYASAAIPDPTWTATVAAPLAALGRLLDVEDIAAARAAGG